MNKTKSVTKKKAACTSDRVLDIVKVLILAFVVIVTIYPFWNVFIVSINDATDSLRGGLYFLPRKLSLAAYSNILNRDISGIHQGQCSQNRGGDACGGACHIHAGIRAVP